MKLNATHKGLITGVVMIAVFSLFSILHQMNNVTLFIVYLIYAAGVLWTLRSFAATNEENIKFGSFFSEGFKCFIIVSLLMVVFWWIYYMLNPWIIDDMVKAGREYMQKLGNATTAEINAKCIEMKKDLPTILTSLNVAKYLILGATITTLCSLLIIQKRKNRYGSIDHYTTL